MDFLEGVWTTDGSFDQDAFQQKMKKLEPLPDEFGEMQGVLRARSVLTQARMVLNDAIDGIRDPESFAGGRRDGDYNINGYDMKQSKPKWEKVVKGTPLEFEDAVSWFENVLRHFPDHLDHLQSKRERPSDLNAEGSPVAKKQKTEPSPVTPPPKANESSSSAKPASKKELRNIGQRCAQCGGPAKIFCSGCEEGKAATYCSQEHQNLHWSKHQPFCKSCTN